MSVTTPLGAAWSSTYGIGQGRGDLEVHVVETLQSYIIPYLADYAAEHGIPPKSLPVPPTPESFHGDLDGTRFSSELFPELAVIVQPTGTVERVDGGVYGSWFDVVVHAYVQVHGDQDRTRALADVYGMALQKLLPQQGAFGVNPDGSVFATRTRLQNPYGLTFPEANVRDVVRASVVVRTFLANLVSDSDGPRVAPQNPYGTPTPIPEAERVDVDLIRGTPDDSGLLAADAVVLDGTVVPPVTEFEQVTVVVPPQDSP